MPSKFNLVSEQWIPVAYDDGSIDAVGWRDLLANSKRIVDIPTNPVHLYGIVVRFATAIFLRTQGAPVKNPSPPPGRRGERSGSKPAWTWSHSTPTSRGGGTGSGSSMTCTRFSRTLRSRSECAERASTNKLFFDVASGNNHLWWTKTPDTEAPMIPFAVAAMALLGQWGYAAGGRCTARNGVANSKQAPERLFSKFIPHGSTLFETLLMCCTPAVLDAELAAKDAPAWEIEPSDTPVPGQLGRLTASTRGLLLFAGDEGVESVVNTWAKGAVGDNFWSADVFMAKRAVGKDKEIVPVRFTPSSVIWREVPSILANMPDVDAQLSPLVLNAARNPLGSTGVFDESGVTVLTHFADKSKDLGWGRSELPDILAAGPMKDPAAFFRLSEFCKIAGEIVSQVAGLVIYKSGPKARPQAPVIPDAEMFVRQLWLDAEDEFYAVLKGDPWEEAAHRLMRCCEDRFDEATEEVGAPQRLAVIIQHRRFLAWRLKNPRGVRTRYQAIGGGVMTYKGPEWAVDLAAQLERWKTSTGVMAELRRGRGKEPIDCVSMHRWVSRFVPENQVGSGKEWAVYTVASQFALHPNLRTCDHSLGWSLKQLAQYSSLSEQQIEARLIQFDSVAHQR